MNLFTVVSNAELSQTIWEKGILLYGTTITLKSLSIGVMLDLLVSFFALLMEKNKNPNAKMQSVIFRSLWKLVTFVIFSVKYYLYIRHYHYSTRNASGRFDLVHYHLKLSKLPDVFQLEDINCEKRMPIARLDELVSKGVVKDEIAYKDSVIEKFSIAKSEIERSLIKYLDKSDISEILHLAEERTSALFLDKDRVFYNNVNYGFVSFNAENAKFRIHISEQDYYSFKFRSEAYELIKSVKPELFSPRNIYGFVPKTGIPLVDTHHFAKASPFLGLIGLGGYVIINRGFGDEFLFVRRSSSLHVGGFWHYSIDETFDSHDFNNATEMVDIETCLFRALSEELGLSFDRNTQAELSSNIKYFGTGIINTDIEEINDVRIETQVLFGLRIELSHRFPWSEFQYKQLRARDKEQEVSNIKLVKLKELELFLTRGDHFSPESVYLARAIKTAAALRQL